MKAQFAIHIPITKPQAPFEDYLSLYQTQPTMKYIDMNQISFSIILISFLGLFTMQSHAQDVHIPDQNFLDALISKGVDLNGDGAIQITEAHAIDSLYFTFISFTSLEGIQSFENLKQFSIEGGEVDTIKFSWFPALEHLYLYSIQFQLFELDQISSLEYLGLGAMNLDEIDLALFPALNFLYLDALNISEIDLSPLSELRHIDFIYLPLSELDLQVVPNLVELYLNDIAINIDLAGLVNLKEASFSGVTQRDLDLSSNPKLEILSLEYNDIKYLDASCCPILRSCNFPMTVEYIFLGSEIDDINVHKLDQLRHMCVLGNQWQEVEDQRIMAGLDFILEYDCFFLADCRYGLFFINNDLFASTTACDSTQLNNYGMSFKVVSDTNESIYSFIGDLNNPTELGILAFQYGTHKIIPIKSPNVISIMPDTIDLTFDRVKNEHAQFFCIELDELVDFSCQIFPLHERARPGFNSSYRLRITNRGGVTSSGELRLDFNHKLMDFNSAHPVQSEFLLNQLKWNITDLAPGEVRYFRVNFNLNSPTDAPPLNGGEVLTFRASAKSNIFDEVPSNNEQILKQTVFNSFDPNDKRCLEGDFIAIEDVGDYLHYLIRFENLGTASAINVIVRDVIDTEKFDVNTLEAVDGSHSFYTRVKEGNIVDFVFEDINLPFEDDMNDGFVMYRIKSKPTLALGDTLFNTADIYFDFNLPITTNTTKTVVTEVVSSVHNSVSKEHVEVYPLPVGDVLFIKSKEKMEAWSLYSLEGRLIKTEDIFGIATQHSIDVATYTEGFYLLKIKTVQGEFIKKVIIE